MTRRSAASWVFALLTGATLLTAGRLGALEPLQGPVPGTMAVQGVVNQEQVQYGLMRARREQGDRQFWPSPLQFCRWCNPQPEDLNVPSVQNAYREAVQFYRRGSRHSRERRRRLISSVELQREPP